MIAAAIAGGVILFVLWVARHAQDATERHDTQHRPK